MIDTNVSLTGDDPLAGYVNADNIETLGKEKLGDYLGVLTPATLVRVNRAVAVAAGLAR